MDKPEGGFGAMALDLDDRIIDTGVLIINCGGYAPDDGVAEEGDDGDTGTEVELLPKGLFEAEKAYRCNAELKYGLIY